MCMYCNNREDWHANCVTMHTVGEISRCLILLCFAILATDTSCEKTAKSCVDLQLTSDSGDNVVQDNEEGDVHISFVLSDNCTDSPARALVKLSTFGTDRVVDLCTIVIQNNACNVTDRPMGYHCLNTGYNGCSISWRIKTVHKVLMLRLINLITKEEKVISLNITGPAMKKLRTPEIIGICCGVIVAVVSAAVVIRKLIFKGSCARQLQGQVKKERHTISSNVAVRQSQPNTGPSSGRQAQEDIQARPRGLDPPGNQQPVDHQTIASIPPVPKRRRRVYDHIIVPSVTVTRNHGDVYNHINPSTHKALRCHKELNSFTETLDVTAARSEAQIHRYNPLSKNIVTRREAELCNHSMSFAAADPGKKREVLNHRSPKSSDDTFTRNQGQLRIHTTSSSQKELRSPEILYKHAVPSRRSLGSNKSDTGCLTIVPSRTVPPIKQTQECNDTLPSSCTGARSLDQLYNHILPCSCSTPRSQAHKQNHTIRCTYSAVRRQEPTDSQRDPVSQEPEHKAFYDRAVLPQNYRRQVVHSMYDYVSY